MIRISKSTIKRLFASGRRMKEIAPDEIFLDSSNLPEFDTHQFEGRIEKPLGRKTVLFVGALFALVGFVFVGKLGVLQIANGDSFQVRSENNHLKHTTLFADRGLILDRNGVELAKNDLNTVDEFSLRSFAEIPGIAHMVGYIRYPAKDKFGIYYDDRTTGMDGAELVFNDVLSGQNGLKITETDALGDVQSENTQRPPRDGENITLAIDARLEEKLYEMMRQTVEEFGFKGGAGVIMDINTGEILALASFPEYDSLTMTEGKDIERIEGLLTASDNPFLNRAVSGLYIPGSIIKPFMAIAALEEGIITPEKAILSTGSISIRNPYDPTLFTVFRDWKAHGWVDMREAIAISSNVYFFSIGGGYGDQPGLGIAKIKSDIERFGFGAQTGINLPQEAEGNVPSPAWKEKQFGVDIWRVGDTYNTSIGQYGFQVTPIQVARAFASLGNGGFLVTPTIVKYPEGKRGRAQELPFRKENLAVAREGMRLSVLHGTASGLSMPGLAIAAKTGTAELGTAKEYVNSWVAGIFPYNDPKYSFAVIMERGPRVNTIGATYVMRQLFEWMYVNTPEYVK